MKFKGTKGEWKATKNNAFWEIRENNNDWKVSINVMLFDENMKSLSLSSHNEANAKLIAAAPDLLRALKTLLNEKAIDGEFEVIANIAIEKALK